MQILKLRHIVTALLIPLITCAVLIPRAAAQSQLARFTNVNYTIYPRPYNFRVPLIEVGNIRAGPLRIHPHMGVALSYTDNVFRTNANEDSDLYWTLAPGGQAQMRFLGRHMFVADYRSNIERYTQNPSQNIEDQTIAGNLLLNFPGGLSIRAIGELKDGHDYRGTATANPATLSGEPNRFYTPNGGLEVEYAKQLYVLASYRYLDWQFIGPQAGPSNAQGPGDISTRNRIENYYRLAAGGRVLPKTYMYVGGLISTHLYAFNKDLDSTTYNVGAGIKWEITGKTVGRFAFGWQQKNFANASLTRGNENFSGPAFRGNIFWSPQEQTTVNLGLIRTTNETVVGGTRTFVRTGFSLHAKHSFTYKWRATGRFYYAHDEYGPDPITTAAQTAVRDDDYIDIGVGLWYQVQPWLGARATYTNSRRLSNFSSVEYVANIMMLSLQAQF